MNRNERMGIDVLKHFGAPTGRIPIDAAHIDTSIEGQVTVVWDSEYLFDADGRHIIKNGQFSKRTGGSILIKVVR